MANAKEIQNRISSIQDTMKITKAMYMISSTKLKKARTALEETEPYFYSLQAEIGRILRHLPDMEHIYLDNREEDRRETVKKRGLVVVTADKGMAGAYNHNVLKKALEILEEPGEHDLFVVGEIGRHFFASKGIEVKTQFHYTAQKPTMHRARTIMEELVSLYDAGELDEIDIIYTRMVNSIAEEVEHERLLPLKRKEFNPDTMKMALDMYQEEFVLFPSPQAVLESLVPNYITGFLYGALIESYSGEQNARMMAMQAANDSANSMLKELSVAYNRVRQSAITQEINEVIGGAKALKKKKKR